MVMKKDGRRLKGRVDAGTNAVWQSGLVCVTVVFFFFGNSLRITLGSSNCNAQLHTFTVSNLLRILYADCLLEHQAIRATTI